MAPETNQADMVCRYCGRSISSIRQLSAHETRCAQTLYDMQAQSVNTMLSAKSKHGTTLGQHHAELDTTKPRRSRLKDSLDRHYHEIMLAEMTLELVLILVLVILAWKQS